MRRLEFLSSVDRTLDRRPEGERDRFQEVILAWVESMTIALETAEGREFTRDTRALAAVHLLTLGRSKLYDVVTLEQIARLAGIPDTNRETGEFLGKHTSDALKKWHRRGALIYSESTVRGRAGWVGLPGSQMQQLPLMQTVRGATTAPVLTPSGSPNSELGEPQAPQPESSSGSPSKVEKPLAAAAEVEMNEELERALEELGVRSPKVRLEAYADPERALSWANVAAAKARENPAGYFVTAFRSGDWPHRRSSRAAAPIRSGEPRTVTPAPRRAWVENCSVCQAQFSTTDEREAYCPACRKTT